MREYKIEEIKPIFDETRRKIDENIKDFRSQRIPSLTPEKVFWDECFSKLEGIYPRCMADPAFSNFFSINGKELTGKGGRLYRNFYPRFSGKAQIELIKDFDFDDYETFFPGIMEKLENIIMQKIYSADYERLELEDYLINGVPNENPAFIEMQPAIRDVKGIKGDKLEKGAVMRKTWTKVFDPFDGTFHKEYSREGVFIPFNDFSRAEVVGKSETDLSNGFTAVSAITKNLNYKNMHGLLSQMGLLPKIENIYQQGHDISEIRDVISDRNITQISQIMNDINEAKRGREAGNIEQQQQM